MKMALNDNLSEFSSVVDLLTPHTVIKEEIKEEPVEEGFENINANNQIKTEFVDVGTKIEDIDLKTESESWNTEQTLSVESWKFNLTSIGVINAANQFEKHYQIKTKPNSNEYKNYHILVSHPRHNDAKTRWKLFIPAFSMISPVSLHSSSANEL